MSTAAEIAVVIPSWDAARAGELIWQLARRERRQRAEYIVVGCAEPDGLHKNLRALSRWIVPDTKLSPVEAMAQAGRLLLAEATGHSGDSNIFLFLHDDVLPTSEKPGWDSTLIDHFETNPRCGLAGFGGALGFATDDIYKMPYSRNQLARLGFLSNMREAEKHGKRVTKPVRVAALDGFALATSREFYTRGGMIEREAGHAVVRGAWDACLRDGIQFHMYDAWLSCRAAELGFETWMLPVECHHAGGQTSVTRQAEYAEVVKRLGYASPEDLYERGHTRVYERFHRILPIRVPWHESYKGAI